MHRILVVVFSLVFIIVRMNGASIQRSTSIDEDAIELGRLAEEFWSLKPAVFQQKGPLVLCQFIDECCATENRLHAMSLMVPSIVNEYRSKNRYGQILNTCINLNAMEEANQVCPLLHNIISPLITEEDRFNIIQHRRVIANRFTELNNLMNHIYKSCNNEEIHALLCLSNTRLIAKCANKILQDIYDDTNEEVYEKFIMGTRETLIDMNQQLTRLLGNDRNTD